MIRLITNEFKLLANASLRFYSKTSSNFRRKGQDLENINYIRSLLNKKPTEPFDSKIIHSCLSPVTSITVSESINLKKYRKTDFLVLVPDEVINIKDGNNDIMVLSNGTVVGWGVDETYLINKFIPNLDDCIAEKYNYESDEMDWVEQESNEANGAAAIEGGLYMDGELMIIRGNTENKKLLDKAAFAIGLSRSTRLAVLETALENHIQLTRINSEKLSKGEKLKITESEVLKLTGRLFLLRGKLNLYSELIETPDLYWAEPTLEKIYESVSKTLDISPRISILNRKLDYATEESRALLSVLNEKKSTRLEWVIIILIAVEVVFELEKQLDRLRS